MKSNRKVLTRKAVTHILCIAVALFMLMPFILMLGMSFMTREEILQIPRPVFGAGFEFSNYVECFKLAGRYYDDFGNEGPWYMLLYLRNSFTVILLNTLGAVISSSICAYGFSKINFKYRDKLFFLVLTTMMIPGTVTMIPMFRVYKVFGMLDSLTPLWLPIWFGGGAVNIFLLKQYMHGIPKEICESATIDGARHFHKWLFIIMPNCKPILAYICLSAIMGCWTDFFTPLLYVNTKYKWTFALGVSNIITSNDASSTTKLNLLMAACVIMSLLPLTLFVAGQKFFVDTMSFSGLKS